MPGTKYNLTKAWPYTHEGQLAYTTDLITMLKKHTQVDGLSWWYAEANAYGCTGSLSEGWYNASLFNNETGRALPALYALKTFLDGRTAIRDIHTDEADGNSWYSLQGTRLGTQPSRWGVYIRGGRKVIVK